MGVPPDIIGHTIKSANTSNTGAATNKVVVASAGTNTGIRVVSVKFSSSAACTFTLEDADATQIGKWLNVTHLTLTPDDLWSVNGNTTASNKSLQYDTSTGNSEITVEYYERSRV